MGQHSSVLQPLLLGILIAKCLPVKKIQEFSEGCFFMLKLNPNPHSYVPVRPELYTWVLLATVLLVGCIFLVGACSRDTGRMCLAVQFCIHRLVWLSQAGCALLILLFPKCSWFWVLSSSCTGTLQSASSAQKMSQVFWFWWAQPIHEPSSASQVFPAEVYWGILCAAGVRDVVEETSVSQESLQDCSIQVRGNGTSCNSQAGDSL